jgi:hypothetical protein
VFASVVYLATRGTRWSVGAFLVGLGIFFVPCFLMFLIIDAGSTLLAGERERNERAGVEPSPLDSGREWRRWREQHPDDDAFDG